MQPLRVDRTHILSRVILLELRTDLENFKPIVDGIKNSEAQIEAEEKISRRSLNTISANESE
jgi:hypothetical protein